MHTKVELAKAADMHKPERCRPCHASSRRGPACTRSRALSSPGTGGHPEAHASSLARLLLTVAAMLPPRARSQSSLLCPHSSRPPRDHILGPPRHRPLPLLRPPPGKRIPLPPLHSRVFFNPFYTILSLSLSLPARQISS